MPLTDRIDILRRPPIPALDTYHVVMIRSLHLEASAGRWVAVDRDDRVVAEAESVSDLLETLARNDISGVEIMQALDPNEPPTYGLG